MTRWWMYVVRCSDRSLYTGITTDPERRVHEHNSTAKGSRYTRRRRPVELVVQWEYECRSSASKAEWAFKQFTRAEKLRRIADDEAPIA